MELDESVISLSSVDISEPVSDKHIKEVSKMYIIELIVGCLGGLNLIGNPKKFIEEIFDKNLKEELLKKNNDMKVKP